MVQRRAVFKVADQQKVVYDLSNGAIFKAPERPSTPGLKVTTFLTLNIS